MISTLRKYTALSVPRAIVAPEGTIYSTQPQVVHLKGQEGEYVIKGPDPHIVFAEAASYHLARLLDINVPEFGLCVLPQEPEAEYFCCRKIQYRHPLESFLTDRRSSIVTNPHMISNVIVFDTWIANEDRNMNNFIVGPSSIETFSGIELYAIDFEKSAVLRGEKNRFSITAIEPTSLWPREALGVRCKELDFKMPHSFCTQLKSLDRTVIETSLLSVKSSMSCSQIDWIETSFDILLKRQDSIASLAEEVWQNGN